MHSRLRTLSEMRCKGESCAVFIGEERIVASR
jgi:hypothetical protein